MIAAVSAAVLLAAGGAHPGDAVHTRRSRRDGPAAATVRRHRAQTVVNMFSYTPDTIDQA